MRVALLVALAASCASGGARREPVIPAIHDQTIVFGQRIGPVSLGMTEAQLVEAVGKPDGEQSYGGNRRALQFPKLKLHVVVDTGRVVFVSPLDATYATADGLRVGASEHHLKPIASSAARTERKGTMSYCFADGTLVTVAGEGASMPASVCAPGQICDIALGGCPAR